MRDLKTVLLEQKMLAFRTFLDRAAGEVPEGVDPESFVRGLKAGWVAGFVDGAEQGAEMMRQMYGSD